MRKILLIEDSSQSLRGGGQKVTSLVLRTFAENNCKILYADFKRNPFLLAALKNGSSAVGLLHPNYSNKNFSIKSFITVAAIIPNLWRLVKIARGYNLIYTTTKRSLIYGSLVAQITSKPIVYHAHMLLQEKWYDKLILALIKKAERCICVSQFTLEHYEVQGLTNCVLLQNPIENCIHPNANPYTHTPLKIGYFGSIIPEKGISFLLQAITAVRDLAVECHIYGEGVLLTQLKEQYKAESHIYFHGYTDNVAGELNENVHVLVLPTVIPESSSLIIQQAMSVGVPVITTKIGAQSKLVVDGENGLLVAPKSIIEIELAIRRFINEPNLYKTMSQNCIKYAQMFNTAERFKKQLMDIVDSILTKT